MLYARSRWVVIALVAAMIIGTLLTRTVWSSADPGSPTPTPRNSASSLPPSDEGDPESAPVPDPLTVGVEAKSGEPRLVDGHGRTLYAFSLDKAGKAACNGACAQAWWPVRSLGGKPQPGAGVNAPNVGNFQRADGSGQVTFRGHPLYYSIKDQHPGDRKGEQSSEFGGTWTAVPPTADARANGSR